MAAAHKENPRRRALGDSFMATRMAASVNRRMNTRVTRQPLA
jgi:hypothetical protein